MDATSATLPASVLSTMARIFGARAMRDSKACFAVTVAASFAAVSLMRRSIQGTDSFFRKSISR